MASTVICTLLPVAVREMTNNEKYTEILMTAALAMKPFYKTFVNELSAAHIETCDFMKPGPKYHPDKAVLCLENFLQDASNTLFDVVLNETLKEVVLDEFNSAVNKEKL